MMFIEITILLLIWVMQSKNEKNEEERRIEERRGWHLLHVNKGEI